jgi:hypothetical protein
MKILSYSLVLALFMGISPLSLNAETWYISNKGADTNKGDKTHPFKTISKGAELAQAGDTVFVLAGIYRERVAPARSGTANSPIVYMGEPGKQVFIKGSDVYDKKWSKIAKNIFSADLNRMQFSDDVYWDDSNPFKVGSSVTPYFREFEKNVPGNGYTLGQVFIDGQAYMQTPLKKEMEALSGSWWYDAAKNSVLIHFKPGHSTGNLTELTTRRRIFAPHSKGLGYIHVSGFIMEHCGNQFPLDFWAVKENAQAGALGLRCGHHWIVKNNTVRYAANIGIDCGIFGYMNERNDQADTNGEMSTGNIFENNYLIDNGCAGITGCGSGNMIVRGNVVMYNDNQLYGFGIFEQAGIKFHACKDALISDNYVANNFTYGIWLDNEFPQARVSRNTIVENGRAGVFIEMSDYDFGSVLVDHNVIMDNKENQIYMHDASGAMYVNNLIAGTKLCERIEPPLAPGAGVVKRGEQFGQGVFIRQMTERTRSYHNAFYNNIFCNNDKTIDVVYPLGKGGEQRFLGNLYDSDERMMCINITDRKKAPSPLNKEAFKIRMAEELKTELSSLNFYEYSDDTKRVALTLAEWQKFWLLHSMHNDNDAQIMEGLSAKYLPATQSVQLVLSGQTDKRINTRWNTNYKQIYKLKEDSAYPGPFENLKTGSNTYSVYQGLPPVKSGQLPNF